MPESVEGLLDYHLPDDVQRVLTHMANVVRLSVNAGTHAIKWCNNPSVSANESIIVLLLRHVLECGDGVSVLVERGCTLPAMFSLRSMFEATLSLELISGDTSGRTALCYRLAHLMKQVTWLKRADASRTEGTDFRQIIAGDQWIKQMNVQSMDTRKDVMRLEARMSDAQFAPILAEWNTCKKKRPVHWYSLFNGPKSVRQLAKNLGALAMYEVLYDHWSERMHAASALLSLDRKADGSPAFRPLRFPKECQALASIGASLILRASRIALSRLAKEHTGELDYFYIAHIRKDFRALSGKDMLVVK